MSVITGTHLGPYRVLGTLGAGGMGVVYRAVDTRLDRPVALKILPETLAAEPRRRQRFEREARVISSLNHPHICCLYDVGQYDGIDFLVLELLEGETLATQLARRPLTVEQALRCGAEIAEALDAAHRKGVVHRDLKPGNVMLTNTGVKLLDFGLARQAVEDPVGMLSTANQADGPLTEDGAVIGTIHYMAPEQLEAEEPDVRTDIFALGVVLYEMVTGRRAFEGKSRAALIAAILEHHPPQLTAVEPRVPAALEHCVARCLAKNPADRWQTAKDVAAELRWIASAGESAGQRTVNLPWPARRWMWIAAGTLGIGLAAGAMLTRSQPPISASRPAAPVRFDVHLPAGLALLSGGAISPDSKHLAFVARDAPGRIQLWLRPLDGPDALARPLRDTDDAAAPFWSPDSASVAFFAGRRLRSVEIADGKTRTITELSPTGSERNEASGSWNAAGVIIFSPGVFASGIYRVADSGGVPAPVTSLDTPHGDTGHVWPVFLPDGRHFLFGLASTVERRDGLYVGSIDGMPSQKIGRIGSRGTNVRGPRSLYAPPGYLLLLDRSTLVAVPFDAERMAVSGEPRNVVEGAGYLGVRANSAAYLSDEGHLTFLPASAEGASHLEWRSRDGEILAVVPNSNNLRDPAISPDGTLVMTTRAGTAEAWLLDIARGTASRFTPEGRKCFEPLWSTDGQSVVCSEQMNEGNRIVRFTRSQPEAVETILPPRPTMTNPNDWSVDGRYIAYNTIDAATRWDIDTLPLFGARQPFHYLHTAVDEIWPRFSPDGHWIAYASNESGRFEVYVNSFPQPGDRRPVSANGGREPAWRADGREMYYLSLDGWLTAVPVRGGPDLSFGLPQRLFHVQTTRRARNHYAVAPGGSRFVVDVAEDRPEGRVISVLLNWTRVLKQ